MAPPVAFQRYVFVVALDGTTVRCTKQSTIASITVPAPVPDPGSGDYRGHPMISAHGAAGIEHGNNFWW